MDVNFLLYLVLFLFGINIGSFLNVLIDRLPRNEQVFKGRSYCDHCRHQLSWLDLFPIFSWLFLRRRCRFCHSPISVQYPLVEGATGVLFVLTYYLSPPGSIYDLLSMIYYLFLVSVFVVIFVIDLKYQLILDHLIYPAIAASFIFQIINHPPAGRSEIINITNPLLSAFGAGLFFVLIVIVTRGRGMGVGDVKLVFLMGLVLGFPGIVVALYLAFLTGAFGGVILILVGKKRFGQHIPFGPFLVGSTLVALWWGENIWQFFEKLLGFS